MDFAFSYEAPMRRSSFATRCRWFTRDVTGGQGRNVKSSRTVATPAEPTVEASSGLVTKYGHHAL